MHVIQQPRRFRRKGWIILAAFLIAAILAGGTSAAISALRARGQPRYQSAVGTPVFLPSPTRTSSAARSGSGAGSLPPSPISGPASKGTAPALPANRGVVYSDTNGVYLFRTDTITPKKLSTPGYTSLVPPLLTSDGNVFYAGDGIYVLHLLYGDPTTPFQIASIDPQTEVIASMTTSADGQEVFWSVEPHDGSGAISFYEATLTADGGATLPALLYTQPANNCPCYMIFGLAGAGAQGGATLLFTDNLGTPADQGTGLWAFDQQQQQVGQELLAEAQGQAPLVLSPDHSLLAYAPTTGVVPEPTDNSVPAQIGSQPYGNSMAVVSWQANGTGNPTTILSPQINVHSFSAYHWITTPIFSPDDQSLAYIQFSSDDTGPYDRHSTLYITPTNGRHPPVVVANFSARLVELGTWIDSHTLLLYADNGMYAIDTYTSAISLLTVVRGYVHIVGLVQVTSEAPGIANCHPHCAG